jgi:RIO kinase 1
MRIPESLASLAEHGAIEDVVRPLMSGKEAQVYLVMSGGKECIAKVYKQAQQRAFRNRAEYTEGRRTRNTRDQRAMSKRTQYGRAQDEVAWHSTESEMIYRLRAAGVRVPKPLRYMDGVLLMELVMDAEGEPAPRLGDLVLTPAEATAIYDRVLREVIRMLCAGVVHGDLSDFNVLMAADGPVIIDLPQAVDAAKNPNARKLLVRDVDNLHRFLARYVPGARIRHLAEEMWDLYESDSLKPDTVLTGEYKPSQARANTDAVLEMIDDAAWDERARREARGLAGGPPAPKRRHAAPAHGAGRPNPPRRDPPAPPAPSHRPRAGAPGTKASVEAMMSAIEQSRGRPASEAASHRAADAARTHDRGPARRPPQGDRANPPGPPAAGAGAPRRKRRRRR